MGSAEPRSFSRGNRGIAGTLIFSIFDRDALLESFKDDFEQKNIKVQKYIANEPTVNGTKTGFMSVEDWDDMMSGLISNSAETAESGGATSIVGEFTPHYADEILPFDITLTFN